MDAITQVPASPEVKAEQVKRAKRSRVAVVSWTLALAAGVAVWLLAGQLVLTIAGWLA